MADVTLLDYYLGNLWNGLKCLAGPYRSGSWQWDSPELESEINADSAKQDAESDDERTAAWGRARLRALGELD